MKQPFFLAIILLPIVNINLIGQCSKYQNDRAVFLLENFANTYVDNQFDGGTYIKTTMLNCYYNDYTHNLEIDALIKFNGNIILENEYIIKGFLICTPENKLNFKVYFRNENANSYLSLNDWKGIFDAVTGLVSYMSTDSPTSTNVNLPIRTTTWIPKQIEVISREFKDQRDGKLYTIVKLGNSEWIWENLKYDGLGIKARKICNDCGRIYNLTESKNVCPVGTDLPTYEDWWNLLSYYDPMILASKGKYDSYWDSDGVKRFLKLTGYSSREAKIYDQEKHALHAFMPTRNKEAYVKLVSSGFIKLNSGFATNTANGTTYYSNMDVVNYGYYTHHTSMQRVLLAQKDFESVYFSGGRYYDNETFLPVKCIIVGNIEEHRNSTIVGKKLLTKSISTNPNINLNIIKVERKEEDLRIVEQLNRAIGTEEIKVLKYRYPEVYDEEGLRIKLCLFGDNTFSLLYTPPKSRSYFLFKALPVSYLVDGNLIKSIDMEIGKIIINEGDFVIDLNTVTAITLPD